MTTELTLRVIDDEPRVLDTDLAERLGMARPTNIRSDVILPNKEELEGFGALCSRRLQTGGRPGTAYYLNEEQALLVCALSRTEKAKAIRAELIRVFVAWRRGELGHRQGPTFQIPQTYAEALRLAADEHEQRVLAENKARVLEAEVEVLSEEVVKSDTVINTIFANHKETKRLSQVWGKFAGAEGFHKNLVGCTYA